MQRLSHYVALSDASKRCLIALEKDERSYPRNTEVYAAGEPNKNLFVVKSGWLYSYTNHIDGRRQIVKLHHPGDVIGFSDLAFTETTTFLWAADAACLCPFPKDGLEAVFSTSAQLSALLFTLAARDQVLLIDVIRAIGRMQARDRLAYLLLDIAHKLRITNTSMTSTFRLPLTQTEIGDAIGLTNVYVSRSFFNLEKAGYIRRSGGEVNILDEAAMIDLCDFSDRYGAVDTSWFPLPAN